MNIKNISILSYALFFGFFGYALLMLALGDVRLTDGALDHEELFLYEKIILTSSLLGIVFIWLYALYKTIKRRHFKWFFFVYLLWPLSIVYIHKYDE